MPLLPTTDYGASIIPRPFPLAVGAPLDRYSNFPNPSTPLFNKMIQEMKDKDDNKRREIFDKYSKELDEKYIKLYGMHASPMRLIPHVIDGSVQRWNASLGYAYIEAFRNEELGIPKEFVDRIKKEVQNEENKKLKRIEYERMAKVAPQGRLFRLPQKNKVVTQKNKVVTQNLLGYNTPKNLLKFPSREEELQGLFNVKKNNKVKKERKTRKNRSRKSRRNNRK